MFAGKIVDGRFFLSVLFLFSFHFAGAQVLTNDAGAREKHFIYEVKQIDEFFERFNNDTGSFIRKVYKTKHIQYKIDRVTLIKSLFNNETQSWNKPLVDGFVKDVTQTANPGKINFQKNGWFAEAWCKFQYNGAIIDIPVILNIVTDEKNRSKWMIAAVKPNDVKAGNTVAPVQQNKNNPVFINPASHANNFIELDKAFNDKQNLSGYFEPAFFERKNAPAFYDAVLKNRIKFLYVKNVDYYFLQINGWIFTVTYFQRASWNAGWLINSLIKASDADKKNYLQTLLEEK